MKYTLLVWRQAGPNKEGKLVRYDVDGINPDMSFLEMLDFVNEKLIKEGTDPIEFDSDCREGICGSCGCMINGQAHGPQLAVATCQLYMRSFAEGSVISIEPWRAKAFPVIKDLVVDRASMDRIIQAGGYTSAKTSRHADANSMLIPKEDADFAMELAACIGCGGCVAACPNASASLFTAAKIVQMSHLPQGQVERKTRVARMVGQMDKEGFGNCSNIGECAAACPAEIPLESIAKMKCEYIKAI